MASAFSDLSSLHTLEAAAAAIGRSIGSLHRYIAEGRIHTTRVLGRTLIEQSEIDRFGKVIAGRRRAASRARVR